MEKAKRAGLNSDILKLKTVISIMSISFNERERIKFGGSHCCQKMFSLVDLSESTRFVCLFVFLLHLFCSLSWLNTCLKLSEKFGVK